DRLQQHEPEVDVVEHQPDRAGGARRRVAVLIPVRAAKTGEGVNVVRTDLQNGHLGRRTTADREGLRRALLEGEDAADVDELTDGQPDLALGVDDLLGQRDVDVRTKQARGDLEPGCAEAVDEVDDVGAAGGAVDLDVQVADGDREGVEA